MRFRSIIAAVMALLVSPAGAAHADPAGPAPLLDAPAGAEVEPRTTPSPPSTG